MEKQIRKHRRQLKDDANVDVVCLDGAGHGGLVFESDYMQTAMTAIQNVVTRC